MNNSVETIGRIGGSNLLDYWEIVKRRRHILVGFCMICTVVTAVVNLLMTDIYRATTVVEIEGEDTDVLQAAESSPTRGVSFDIFENYLETQMLKIKSTGVAGEVFKKNELAQSEVYVNSTDPLKAFKDNITLERLKGTRTVMISVDDPDPETSALLANNLAQVYAQDNLRRRAWTFIRNQRMASLNAEFLRLQSKLDTLSNQYGPKHPEMVSLRNEIRTMAKRMAHERMIPENLMDQFEITDNQSLLEEALLKIQESTVFSSSRMNNVNVIEKAAVPLKKHTPRRTFNTLISFVMGLVGGIFLAFIIEYLDDTFQSDDDLKRILKERLFLGSVPFERDIAFRKPSKLDQLIHLKPSSPAAEAYRLIRIGIEWYIGKKEDFRDFAVLSSIPEEGKTSVATNLAIAFSQIRNKVLLVDTDFRKGRIHKTFQLKSDTGLAQYLTDEAPFSGVIQKTEIPNLSVVPIGNVKVNSSALASSPKLFDFIGEARKRYDLVIYDTPPISIVSDTAQVLSHLHGAVLVTRSNVTNRRILPRVIHMIHQSNTLFIGAILNAAEYSKKEYYSKYYDQKK